MVVPPLGINMGCVGRGQQQVFIDIFIDITAIILKGGETGKNKTGEIFDM